MAPRASVLAVTMPVDASAPPKLVVTGITKSFGGPQPAVEDVGFTVRAHEFVAVLGPSGAGKTTLFRCVTGLLAPEIGRAHV